MISTQYCCSTPCLLLSHDHKQQFNELSTLQQDRQDRLTLKTQNWLFNSIGTGSNKSWYFISKNQPGLRCSDPLKSSPSSRCLLVSDSVGTTSSCSLLAFPLSVSLVPSRLVASAFRYPSRTCNCARLLIVATQSSHLNCLSRLSKVAWQQCRLHDVIIVHVISVDAQIYIYTYTDVENAK